MKVINNIINYFNPTKPANIKVTPKGLQPELKAVKQWQFTAEIDDLKHAIDVAMDEHLPSRELLQNIYQGFTDLHVRSQLRTAEFSVLSEPFYILNDNNSINQEATDLLKKKWFFDLIKEFVRTEWHGHSLLYFWIENGEFTKTNVMKRQHVVPQRGAIMLDLSDPERLVPYRSNPELAKFFIEIGGPEDLGLLKDVCKYIIYKQYSLGDWARSSEKWGDPHIMLKTDESGKEIEKKEAFLKNFGHNAYGIFGKDDELTLLEKKEGANGHMLFLDLVKLMNEENSKGINGQTATSDEKAFVGAAEVQERVLNTYTKARLMELSFFMNETALPWLTNYLNGQTKYSILKGCKFMTKGQYDDEILKLDPKNANNGEKTNLENTFVNPFQ